jgi:hypothetical protein
MRTPHTAVKKGKRAKVVLKNGETFIDKFIDRKSRYVTFETRRVLKGEIKSFAIFKK